MRINLTVTSKGRQFDRLASLYLGDTEIFRTSTAEPTPNGIVWTYIKDLSPYNVLWKHPQKVLLDLGNVITDVYTGPFDVVVTAHFSHENNTRTADVILPISAKKSASNSPSAFQLPSDNATTNYTIPASASRAILSISACGQSDEEFWWSNVFSSDTDTFSSSYGQLYGYSSFREVQAYVDGSLAGVVWPFPVIFTGGVAPGLWKPIVGIDAFDLRQPEIDISPFLPLLTDGNDHSFEIRVAGLDVSEGDRTVKLTESVGSYWVVTGTIFLYLDQNPPSNSNKSVEVFAPAPIFNFTRNLVQNQTGGNESLSYSVTVDRTFSVSSSHFSWLQNLSFSNSGLYDQQGFNQENQQLTSGQSSAAQIGKSGKPSQVAFEYPLSANQTYGTSSDVTTIDASVERGLHITDTGEPWISTYTFTSGPSSQHTNQHGKAHYESGSGGQYTSSGDTTVDFESNAGSKDYERHVRAINGSVVSDTDSPRKTSLSFGQIRVPETGVH